MSSFRTRYASFLKLRRIESESAIGAAVLSIADVADAIICDGHVTAARLDALSKGARSEHLIVWQAAAEMLGALASRWHSVIPAYLVFAKHPKGAVRLAALRALTRNMPRHVIDTLLLAGLDDKHGDCRRQASFLAVEFGKRQFLPVMTQTLARETSKRARTQIERSIALMVDDANGHQSTGAVENANAVSSFGAHSADGS